MFGPSIRHLSKWRYTHFPETAGLVACEVSRAKPVCLFEYLISVDRGLPDRILILEKESVAVREFGRACLHKEGLVIIDRVGRRGDQDPGSSGDKKNPKSGIFPPRAQALEFRDAFGLVRS